MGDGFDYLEIVLRPLQIVDKDIVNCLGCHEFWLRASFIGGKTAL